VGTFLEGRKAPQAVSSARRDLPVPEQQAQAGRADRRPRGMDDPNGGTL
jgi:hypothetical protein